MTDFRSLMAFLDSLSLTPAHLTAIEAGDHRHLPYHNAEHCFQTAQRAAALAVHVGIDPAPVALAGLYHDADHRGPAVPEPINIENAVTWWLMEGVPRQRRARPASIDDRNDPSHVQPPDWFDDIPRLIRSTCFPHNPTDRLDELVLRDADLAQTLTPGWLAKYEAETGTPADPDFAATHLTWPDFFTEETS